MRSFGTDISAASTLRSVELSWLLRRGAWLIALCTRQAHYWGKLLKKRSNRYSNQRLLSRPTQNGPAQSPLSLTRMAQSYFTLRIISSMLWHSEIYTCPKNEQTNGFPWENQHILNSRWKLWLFENESWSAQNNDEDFYKSSWSPSTSTHAPWPEKRISKIPVSNRHHIIVSIGVVSLDASRRYRALFQKHQELLNAIVTSTDHSVKCRSHLHTK